MAKKNFKKASGKSYEKSHAKKPQDPKTHMVTNL